MKRQLLVLLSAVFLLLRIPVSAEESRKNSTGAYATDINRVWSGAEVTALMQELEAEADSAIDDAYSKGYGAGYAEGTKDSSARCRSTSFRQRAADFAIGFLSGTGTCLAVGITISLR
jgi:hypothetical protein